MNNLIVGYGEIGKAVHAIIGEADIVDEGITSPEGALYDVMHVCFPYTEGFLKSIEGYIGRFSPQHLIIYSTLPIGITKQIPGAVHSPVEGKHPDLEMSIRQMERWISYNKKDEGFFFVDYFEHLGLKTRMIENTDFTEALKLLSTTEYGVNLVFADYKARVAEGIGMDYELTKEWNREYNRLYDNLGMGKRFQKFVLDSPNGEIGGHCVVPNAELLDEQYPDDILDMIMEMGSK